MPQKPRFVPGDPIATLDNCRGYYRRPKDNDGNWAGPLVGYAKKYGPENKQMVGNLYLDCARLERFPEILARYASMLADDIRQADGIVDWIMGVPEGGKSVALLVALELGVEYIYPDGKTPSDMTAKRHVIEPNTSGWIFEDVCNNYSTTETVLGLVERANATTLGIGCIFNRSGQQMYAGHGIPLPVLSVLEVEAEQFEQEDPAVADDIFEGNVRFEPKACIQELVTIMRNAEAKRDAIETGS
jgi:orotate phosphoribosyltransferase